MEAGKTELSTGSAKLDLINPMIAAGDAEVSDADVERMEEEACPTCGSCSGMFTANTMSSAIEAMGMSLPGAASIPAVDSARNRLHPAACTLAVVLSSRLCLSRWLSSPCF